MSGPRVFLRVVGLLGLTGFLAAAYTPLPNLLFTRLAVSPRIEPADAIVVLGGNVQPDNSPGDESLRRTLHGLGLYRAGLAKVLVLSGSRHDIAARTRLIADLGEPSPRLLTAPSAGTTLDEARQLASFLAPWMVRRVLLVTGALHMRRARQVFERAGFEVLPAPVDRVEVGTRYPDGRLRVMGVVVSESLALLYYRAMGRL